MKEEWNVAPILKITIFLLILDTVNTNSRQWFEQPRRSYFNYGSSDDQISRNNDTEAALRLAWNWPFNHQKVTKVTRHPPSVSKENENDTPQNDKFIFPDMEIVTNHEHKVHRIKIGEAPACAGKTYCEEVPNYPADFLRDAIKNRNLGNYESIDAMDISYRIGAAPTESLCLSTEQIIYPKSAENVNKQWLYIVNQANFTQGVRVETCIKEGAKCEIIGDFAEGYVTSCEQKYIYRQLAAVVEDGSISHELFRFPASCCCHVRFVGSTLRFRPDRSVDRVKTRDAKSRD